MSKFKLFMQRAALIAFASLAFYGAFFAWLGIYRLTIIGIILMVPCALTSLFLKQGNLFLGANLGIFVLLASLRYRDYCTWC